MTTDREQPIQSMHAVADHHHEQQGAGAAIWHFLLHFLEMCISMCIGWAILGAVYLAVARQLGYGDPYSQLPVLSVLVAAFNMCVPMVAWMRFRGMDWRPINEMSAAMFIEAFLLIGIYWLGLVPGSSLVNLLHAFMMPFMLIAMLFRLDLYTGRSGHHMHHAPGGS